MIATMRRASLAALFAGFVAGPALAAGMDGMDNAGPDQAAGSTAYSGSTRSPSGSTRLPSDSSFDSGSDMGHSIAGLPNNDAGTPINNGPALPRGNESY
jgi:hypothetical protein